MNEVEHLKDVLGRFYDLYENGDPCNEVSGDGEFGVSLGNAVKLPFDLEQEILNLIVDKAEPYEQECANCAKPYRAHLLHDGNKCRPGSVAGWFPKSVADAISNSSTT